MEKTLMTILNLRGGLGNQILQLSYALNNLDKFNVNTSSTPLNDLVSSCRCNIYNSILIERLGLLFRFIESKKKGYRSDYSSKLLLDGYFQDNITLKTIPDSLYQCIYNQINLSEVADVDLVIHYRGGDYLDEVNKKIFSEMDCRYYMEAINSLNIKKNLKDIKIKVVSNDIVNAKLIFERIFPNGVFYTFNSELQDFSDIVKAPYAIIPNSTFSLTARMLAHRFGHGIQTAHPQKWFTVESKMTGPNLPEFISI
jgi:hypothetical protein